MLPFSRPAGLSSGPLDEPRLNAQDVSEQRLVISDDLPPSSIEPYRQLATTLYHAQLTRGLKVVVVVSALPSEGKTLTSVNLALTLSEALGREVLLIDADLRRPTIHRLLRVPGKWGLANVLQSDKDSKLPIVRVTSRLSVLASGSSIADPMNGLSSDRLPQIIRSVADSYDWVIIDTPPASILQDASLISRCADGALLVVRAGATPYDAIQRAIDAVGRDRMLGVVLNRTEVHTPDAYYAGYYGIGGRGESTAPQGG
jgi:capsular exopolysaccharide synthesis family protein